MRPQTHARIDGFLAMGPHGLDAQLRTLTDYAGRMGYALDICWVLLPGEDPATAAPDFGVPIVVFDDDIARFTAEEHGVSAPAGGDSEDSVTEWHVAHPVPQAKLATDHLPVYGPASQGEVAADAILCVGEESLDRQIALIEAYAIRSGIRIQGVYLASGPENLRILLQDFRATRRARETALILTVDPEGRIESRA